MTEPEIMTSFAAAPKIVVIGGGGIGAALASRLSAAPGAEVTHLSRRRGAGGFLDVTDEPSIIAAAAAAKARFGALDLVIVATGLLSEGEAISPEKSWAKLSGEAFARLFAVNAAGPALVAKHFLPLLAKNRKSVFAALSARVGSIEDNRLGGWYAYRASKAALNQILKTLSIELARRNPGAICVGLHPGTVETPLSAPFQRNVPPGKLFTPERSAGALLSVIDGLRPEDSGKLFAWDGAEVPF